MPVMQVGWRSALAVGLALTAAVAMSEAAAAQEATEEEQAFLDAAMDGDAQLVRESLEGGVDVNVTYDDEGVSALMQAAAGSHVEVAKVLLEAGAEVDARTSDGMTAFLIAVDACGSNHGDLEIEEPYWQVMRLLAGAGADVNAKDGDGQTAMAIATSYGDERLVKVLAELGAR
jgi:ankyrin repeat protein